MPRHGRLEPATSGARFAFCPVLRSNEVAASAAAMVLSRASATQGLRPYSPARLLLLPSGPRAAPLLVCDERDALVAEGPVVTLAQERDWL